jgi:hypothetical protein
MLYELRMVQVGACSGHRQTVLEGHNASRPIRTGRRRVPGRPLAAGSRTSRTSPGVRRSMSSRILDQGRAMRSHGTVEAVLLGRAMAGNFSISHLVRTGRSQ